MQTALDLSVIIPVKNGMPEIQECIAGILRQSLSVKEIIVIDSGSTDGTLEYLKEEPLVTVHHIPAATFNHGLTRNYGLQFTSGQYVLFTVQDARAYDEYWIENLMAGFTDDVVAAVCGQQVVPHEKTKNPVDWFRPVSEPAIRKFQYSTKEFHKLTPDEKRTACSWDNVTAIYKRSVLETIPFVEISYGEDAVWASQALQQGYALVYNPAARVFHFHLEDADYTFRRTLTASYLRYKLFGSVPGSISIGMKDIVRVIRLLFFKSGLTFQEALQWLQYNRVQWKSYNEAVAAFRSALLSGENAVDALHEKWCGTPPVPLKNL